MLTPHVAALAALSNALHTHTHARAHTRLSARQPRGSVGRRQLPRHAGRRIPSPNLPRFGRGLEAWLPLQAHRHPVWLVAVGSVLPGECGLPLTHSFLATSWIEDFMESVIIETK